MKGNRRRGGLPANGGLAVGWALSRSKGLPYLCLSKSQGQPSDLEILCKLSNLLQINAFLITGRLLGFCDREEFVLKYFTTFRGNDTLVWAKAKVHTTDKLAHFCQVSTGDGCCGVCRGRLQYRWLRRNHNW